MPGALGGIKLPRSRPVGWPGDPEVPWEACGGVADLVRPHDDVRSFRSQRGGQPADGGRRTATDIPCDAGKWERKRARFMGQRLPDVTSRCEYPIACAPPNARTGEEVRAASGTVYRLLLH